MTAGRRCGRCVQNPVFIRRVNKCRCGETKIWASESQGEAGCGEKGRKEISENRKCRQVWKLEGFALSFPNRLSDPWVLCMG